MLYTSIIIIICLQPFDNIRPLTHQDIMAPPLSPDEPLLATLIRVLRKRTLLPHLIETFSYLEQKSLTSPLSPLTLSERRLLLDFPDKEEGTVNISAATRFSRPRRIGESLTEEELLLLKNRFWTPSSDEEHGEVF